MKEEALELAKDIDECPYFDNGTGDIIRKLVAELDKQQCVCGEINNNVIHRTDNPCYIREPLSDEEIEELAHRYFGHPRINREEMYGKMKFARAIEERHGISKEIKED